MKEVNVLFIDNAIGFGGSAVSLSLMLKELRKIVNHFILKTSKEKQLSSFLDSQGLNYFTGLLYFDFEIPQLFLNLIYSKFLKRILIAFSLVIRFTINMPFMLSIAMFAKKNKIQMIHLNNSIKMEGVVIAKFCNLPCVCHVRGFHYPSQLTKFLARHINCYIAISEAIKDDLISLDIPSEKIEIIYNAVDLELFKLPLKEKDTLKEIKVGLFGCLVRWKGHKVFLDAIHLLKGAHLGIDLKFYIVGDVPGKDKSYYQELEEYAQKKGVDDMVIFTGYRSDIASLMQQMDMVVHTSIDPEPFGRVIIEAMASAKPVIATAIGGPLEIIKDGVNGLLIQPNDAQVLCDKIIFLANNPKNRKDLGVMARKTVQENFSRKNYQKVLEIYKKVLKSV